MRSMCLLTLDGVVVRVTHSPVMALLWYTDDQQRRGVEYVKIPLLDYIFLTDEAIVRRAAERLNLPVNLDFMRD